MRPTPETDAEERQGYDLDLMVDPDFARKLERDEARESKWRPIETAPINESVLLLFSKTNHIEDGELFDSERYSLFDGDRMAEFPTHWQPLPTQPES